MVHERRDALVCAHAYQVARVARIRIDATLTHGFRLKKGDYYRFTLDAIYHSPDHWAFRCRKSKQDVVLLIWAFLDITDITDITNPTNPTNPLSTLNELPKTRKKHPNHKKHQNHLTNFKATGSIGVFQQLVTLGAMDVWLCSN